MKFLTDENIAKTVLQALRAAQYDVLDVKEQKLFGAPDKQLLNLAVKENRVIITHDKDFASILLKQTKHYGIILLRFKNQRPQRVADNLIAFLNSKQAPKTKNNLVIITETQVLIHKT